MPKKAKPAPKPELESKLIRFPADWIQRIDEQRGELSFSDFVRQAVLEKIGRAGLAAMPAWGQGRPKK